MGVLPVIFLITALTLVFIFFAAYFLLFKEKNPVADLLENETAALSHPRRRYPMTKKDVLCCILVTAVYTPFAFWGLGYRSSPESFCEFPERGRFVLIELKEETPIYAIMHFSGLHHSGNYYLQFSLDGIDFSNEAVLPQRFSDIFKWHVASLNNPGKSTRFIRIIAGSRLAMGELSIFDASGYPIPPEKMIFNEDAAPLFDEQETVPLIPTHLNSAYFDEIYHARTAYEHIIGERPYEISHPPLGKILIGLGIRIFGLNPFGWRFIGTLFGVLMLPFMYVFIKNLFGSTIVAVCGTTLFAFDFMHFVQTRIATIDTYGVFFTILMYFFMYRYITAPRDDPFMPKWRETLPLFLSGLSFGLGIASKWTAFYAGAGLALIWLLFRISRGRDLIGIGHIREHKRELVENILQCLAFFVLIPALIYYISYYPYGIPRGMSGISMFFTREYFDLVVDNQVFMFTYHVGIEATHPFSSNWYQWIVNARPILYYLRHLPNNDRALIGAFLNPLIAWGGLIAVLAMVWRTVWYKDGKALFILIGYLAQLVPWMFVSRITFAYHYFPCLIFIILAICHVFNSYRLRDPRWKRKIYAATFACLLLFFMFYPILAGIPVPRSYTDLLAWIPGYWSW